MIPMIPMIPMTPHPNNFHDFHDSHDFHDRHGTHDFASAQRTWHIAMRYVQLPEYYNISTLNLVWQKRTTNMSNQTKIERILVSDGGGEKCGVPPRWAWMRLRNETTAGKEASRPLMGLPQCSLC